MTHPERHAIVFAGDTCIAHAPLAALSLTLRRQLDDDPNTNFLVFDAETSAPIDLDLHGSVEDVIACYAPPLEAPAKTGPGRPKLGVVPREVTLLPHQWEWLAGQPGGASATLRKLVEEARKSRAGQDAVRKAQDATYKFMAAMAGNRPHFENALRALYARQETQFHDLIATWPDDIKHHISRLARPAFASTEAVPAPKGQDR